MNSITKSRKKSKPQLTITFERAEPGAPILTTVADPRGNETSYWIERIEADFGIGVELRKLSRDGGEVHHVNLDTVSWIHDCDCLGFLRHGHCRHVSMAISAMDQGLLNIRRGGEKASATEVPVAAPPVLSDDVPDTYCSHCGCLQSAHGGGGEFCPI